MARGSNKRPGFCYPAVRENKACMWYERTPKWKMAEIMQELAVQVDGPAPHEADPNLWFQRVQEAQKIVEGSA